MLHVFYGPDTFTAHEELHRIFEPQQGAEDDRPEVVWMDGAAATPAQIATACQQFSLLSARRVVVVDGLLSRFEPRKPSGDRSRKSKAKKAGLSPEWEAFVPQAAALPDASVLVLIDAELKPGNYLLKALKALPGPDIRFMAAPRGDKLTAWVRQRAEAAGARIDEEAAGLLGSLAAADLWIVHAEIEKLAVYADGRLITADMVKHMTANSASSTIFTLVDAIVEGRQANARLRLEQMYRDGLSAGYIFTMVERQIRIIAQLLEAHRGTAGDEPSAELAGLHEFARDRAAGQSRRFDERRLRRALDAVIVADRSIKTGACTERTALDLLVTDLLPAPTRI